MTASGPGGEAAGDPLPRGAIARLGSTCFRHGGRVMSVAFVREGQDLLVAAAGEGPSISLFELPTGRLRRRLRSRADNPADTHLDVRALGVGRLATWHDDRIRIWNAGDPGPLATFGRAGSAVAGLGVVAGGAHLAAVAGGVVRIFDLETGREVDAIAPVRVPGHVPYELGAIAVSADGRRAATHTGRSAWVHVFDLERREQAGPAFRPDAIESLIGLAISPDGSIVAAGNHEGRIRIWTSSGERVREIEAHRGDVAALAFSPDGKALASVGRYDGRARIFAAASGEPGPDLAGALGTAEALAFSPDGAYVAAGDRHGVVRVWRADSGAEVGVPGGHAAPVTCIAASADGGRLASGAADGSVIVWDVESRSPAAAFRAGKDGVESIALSPGGRTIAWCADDEVRIARDVEAGGSPEPIEGGASAVAFSPDGSRLALAGPERELRILDAATGATVLESEVPGKSGDAASAVAWSPDGRAVAVADWNDDAIVLDAATGAERARVRGLSVGNLNGVAFSPDGALLATARSDGYVGVADAATGREARRIVTHHEVRTVDFSPDGRFVVAAGDCGEHEEIEGGVAVTPAEGGADANRTLRGDSLPRAALFLGEGRIASGHANGTILLWAFDPPSERGAGAGAGVDD